MKASLQRHIETIFATLQIENLPYEVYECRVDVLPAWTEHVSLTYEFLICCEQNRHIDKFKKFLGKEIYQFEDKVYWFEGDKIIELNQTEIELFENTEKTAIDYLKTETRLPAWLDDFIFNQLNAEYAPDFQRFEYNLDLSKDENLKYLGTYFPRSYAESFCIFDNIFQNEKYQQAISRKQTLNILSVGCGTGGDLTGLLTIIEKYCCEIAVNIWAIDGNKEALNILEKIISKFSGISTKKITLKLDTSIFTSIAAIDFLEYNINNVKFDFILSFKMICEIISKGKGLYDNSYYDFVQKFVPLLSDNGLCVLLDVTTKQEHTTFNPILMNSQVNQALRVLKEYQTLLPLPCSCYGNECSNNDCFYQKTFYITHKKYAKDNSRVAYRIIANKNFVEIISGRENEYKLLIHSDKEKYCPFTANHQGQKDAFLLTNQPLSKFKKDSDKVIKSVIECVEPEVIKTETPKLTGIKVVGKIDLSQFEKSNKEANAIYIIDTNVFVECPDILAKINKKYRIILSAKVIDELDNLKTTLPNEEKKNVQKALKLINNSLDKRDIKMDTADLKLLPHDFNKKSPDNFILSVVLKYRDENPILLTSDNGLQIKAKGMNIKTITLKDFLKQIKI